MKDNNKSKIKLCFISDTHNSLEGIINFIPECDYLIHCGDMTNFGTIPELTKVNTQFGEIKNKGLVKKDIIVIAGNHDGGLEKDIYLGKNLFTNAVYLENSSYYLKRNNNLTANDEVLLYGSPITPKFYNWSFMKNKGEDIERYWKMIPEDVEVLITHGPPQGILDQNHLGEACGCPSLRDRIKQLKKLKVHAFGHIHESYGKIKSNDIQFINGATMGKGYVQLNPPILIEI